MEHAEGGGRSDQEELKEIIKEFLYHLDFVYNYRLQKLIFYGELWCLNTYGRRLSDATFIPYHHGSFSEDVDDALEELRESGELAYERVIKKDGPTYKYLHHPEGGALAPGKKEIIKEVHAETRGMETEQLAKFSKQSWLYQNTEEGEPMDFAQYEEDVLPPRDQLTTIAGSIESESPDSSVNSAEDLENLI